jgi:amidase
MTPGSITATAPDICRLGAGALVKAIRHRHVSVAEVMGAYLDHIDRVNPTYNAIISLRPRDVLIAEAREADAALARGEGRGALFGIPQAIKDLANTKGLRTTYGSPLFADFVPEADTVIVERARRAGAIIIGKTNTPEFGLGSNTYNPVHGITRNAYDPGRIAGGSSGGSAVALALRLLPVADGSDMGGSLRNPAAFNNVFGFRPSQGRVPYAPTLDGFFGQLGTEGPMARSVDDLALLLSAQAGYDPRAPLSLDDPGYRFEERLQRDPKGLRIAWGGDLGGHLAIEPGILDLCRSALDILAGLGCKVEEALPRFDFERLWQAFSVLRQFGLIGKLGPVFEDPARRARLKPEAQWEVERALKLSAIDVQRAGDARMAWYQAMLALFEDHDFLALPTAQVFPFTVDQHWPKAIGDRRMDSYHRWMEVVAGATMAGCPAISVPVGFGPEGQPMGMQLIGRPRADLAVLQLARAYEEACPWVAMAP